MNSRRRNQFVGRLINIIVILVTILSLFGGVRTSVRAAGTPWLTATPNQHMVSASDFPLGSNVTVEIYDLDNHLVYTDTQSPYVPPWNQDQTIFQFNVGELEILPGFLITMDDGTDFISHTVLDISINEPSTSSNIASGTSKIDSDLEVCVGYPDLDERKWTRTNENGEWSYDFSYTGRTLSDADEISAEIQDENGNRTEAKWFPEQTNPDNEPHTPSILIRPYQHYVGAFGWKYEEDLTLTIHDPSGSQPDFVGFPQSWGYYRDVPLAGFSFPDYEVKPDFEVTVSGESITRYHVVTKLVLLDVDQETGYASGTALGESDIQLLRCWDDDYVECNYFNFSADFNGNWSVDLSTVGFDFSPNSCFQLRQFDEINYSSTDIEWWSPQSPTLAAWPNQYIVDGNNYPPESSVHLMIDDPGTPEYPDYEDTQSPYIPPWDPDQTIIQFNVGNFEILPDFIITMDDGTDFISHTVLDVTLDDPSPDSNIASGMSTPNADLEVGVGYSDYFDSLWINASGDGNWSVDFSYTGRNLFEAEEIFIHQFDANGNSTGAKWHPSQPPKLPTIAVQMVENQVHGFDWPLGEYITLTIDGTEVGTEVVDLPDWTDNRTFVQFELNDLTLKPGMVVSMEGGGFLKTHTVTSLVVTEVNPENDTVSGTAEPGSSVEVGWICDENGCAIRYTIATDGTWIVDFSVPGGIEPDEQSLFDIKPGTGRDSRQVDEDGDNTNYSWSVPPLPTLAAWPNQCIVDGNNFPLESSVHLMIDDPGTLEYPDYEDTRSPYVPPWDPDQTIIQFNVGNFEILPGYIITMDDGTDFISHTVLDVTLDDPSPDSNIASGMSTPNAELEIGVGYSDYFDSLWINAAEDGTWSVDFSYTGRNLSEAEEIFIQRFDTDGNRTGAKWHPTKPNILYPKIVVRANNDEVTALNWPLGTYLTMTIDDPLTEVDPDYTANGTVDGPTPWGEPNTYLGFDLFGIIDIQPGFRVNLIGGGTNKTLVVTNLAFKNIDQTNDTVIGVGQPYMPVDVWACNNNNCSWRHVDTDEYGDWDANFGEAGTGYDEQDIIDFMAGTWIDSNQTDEDGDNTGYGETVPNPVTPTCSPGNSVAGTVFFGDGSTPMQEVTITIEDYSSGEILFITKSDETGKYNCSLPDGDYRFWADGSSQNLSREYYDETIYETAAHVVTSSSNPLSGIDFIMDTPVIAGIFEQFTFNLDDPILGELAVRQAIALGTDRQRIINEAWLPNGIDGILMDTYVIPDHWGKAIGGGVVSYDYDPTAAMGKLENAGWSDTNGDGIRERYGQALQINFLARDNLPARPITAQIFKENMAAIGIDVVVEIVDSNEWADAVINRREFTLTEFAWGGCSDQNDDFCFPFSNWDTGDGQNFGNYSNLAADYASSAARLENTRAGKLPFLISHQEILSQDLPIFPLFTWIEVTTPTDSDGDGLPDDVDICPNQNPNGYDADGDGCTDTIDGLRQLVVVSPANDIANNIRTSLITKLNNAIQSLNKGNNQAAIGKLQAFINEVKAQSNKKITGETADLLISFAENVIAGIP